MTENKAEYIKNLRKTTGMTRKDFATAYGIPLGTLRNWEQGVRTPPEYVVRMVAQFVEGNWKFICEKSNVKVERVNNLIQQADGICIVFENLQANNINPLEDKRFQKQLFDFLYHCRYLYEFLTDNSCNNRGSLLNILRDYTDSENCEIYRNAVKIVKKLQQNITTEFNL